MGDLAPHLSASSLDCGVLVVGVSLRSPLCTSGLLGEPSSLPCPRRYYKQKHRQFVNTESGRDDGKTVGRYVGGWLGGWVDSYDRSVCMESQYQV